MPQWTCALALNESREITQGSEQALCEAVGRGADLRIATRFRHDEHLEPGSDNKEWVDEVAEFRVTLLLDARWTAAFMTLRAPILPPDGFGPRPSLSFFLYNQNGQQAVARPHLDGRPTTGTPGPSPRNDWSAYPKYHELDVWDAQTNAPSNNFIYAFDSYRFIVRDDWEEVFSHTDSGMAVSGSLDRLTEAFREGCEVKVGISGLCDDLKTDESVSTPHQMFVQTHSCYHATEQRLFTAGTHPIVRVRPRVPARYETHGWDFGWVMARTDGYIARWMCDPYTLQFHKTDSRAAIRWFVR